MEAAAELRALARVARDPRQRVRLLAIANVRAGMPVAAAAPATGMGRATLSAPFGRTAISRSTSSAPCAPGATWAAR